MDLILLVAYGMVGLTTFLLVKAIWGFEMEIQERGQEGVLEGGQPQSPLGRVVLAHARFAGRIVGALVPRPKSEDAIDPNMMLGWVQILRRKIDRALVAAGQPYHLTGNEILGSVPLGLVVGMVVGIYLYMLTERRVLLFPFPFLGAAWPLVWLRDTLERRRLLVRRALPLCADMLTLSVEAGLDFTAALARMVSRLPPGPLADEIGQTLREIRMGKTRKDSFKGLSDRLQMDEVTNLCSALVQADEIGASMGHILRVQSEELRQRRFRRAERAAMEAPVKMIFPLVAFIFPTVFIVIFGPILIRVLTSS